MNVFSCQLRPLLEGWASLHRNCEGLASVRPSPTNRRILSLVPDCDDHASAQEECAGDAHTGEYAPFIARRRVLTCVFSLNAASGSTMTSIEKPHERSPSRANKRPFACWTFAGAKIYGLAARASRQREKSQLRLRGIPDGTANNTNQLPPTKSARNPNRSRLA